MSTAIYRYGQRRNGAIALLEMGLYDDDARTQAIG